MTDLIIVEKSVLEELTSRLERLDKKIGELYLRSGLQDGNRWLDNQDACRLLCASKRTLQNLRDAGVLPFTRIGAKAYYKAADIDRLLSSGYTRKKTTHHE